MQDIILGIVRHALTSAGGSLIAKGLLTAATLDQGIGAVIALAGVAWSVAIKLTAKSVGNDTPPQQ